MFVNNMSQNNSLKKILYTKTDLFISKKVVVYSMLILFSLTIIIHKSNKMNYFKENGRKSVDIEDVTFF